MFRADGIVKSFDGRAVLSGVSLCVNGGETVGLTGASGAGKSTLAKIICGLVRADAGSAEVDGQTVFSDGREYDRRAGTAVQMIFQQPYAALDPSQKISDGIRELVLYRKLADRRGCEKIIDDLCASVELNRGILDRLPHNVSGGEAQRIAIGKSLLMRPKLLILDEATAMLDTATQANVLAAVKREMRKTGGGILMISHDAELINFCCDRTYLLGGGETEEIK